MSTETQPDQREVRTLNYAALTETLLLGGTAALFVVKYMRGQLDFYIHPRYTVLVLLCALLLFLMAGVRMRGVFTEPGPGRLHPVYALLALPLLFGVLVPAQPLGADTLAGRGLDPATMPVAADQNALLAKDPAEWNLMEWATALSIQGEELADTPIEAVGFVFHDPQLGADTFYVARYVVTCCAADAAATGLPVVWDGADALPTDSWVQVTGSVEFIQLEGESRPAIVASQVAPTDEPEVPYLFPQ
jgi:uncharacterized repeat protein (TIGR03943 family)